ncbi:unnamed protein product [Penicillium camemberti]|uniref:Str. FM013 n=1 Tax=Penicillium camemberti (strain FM 013) TaxID=1429867 RepID=A0A0G4P2B6_PENC3|nr:unnamed protein product [Penicillium camemberti]
MHHLMYRQSKARGDILPPQYYRTAMRQIEKSDCYDHHPPCHVKQATPCPRNSSQVHQPPTINETIHCYSCPLFRSQDPWVKMNNIEPDPGAQHHKICCHNRHESSCAHLQPRARSPESSEDEEYHYYTGNYHTQGIHPNERQHHPPTVNHFHPKGPNDIIDRTHRHAAQPERGTFARATVCKSHEDRCSSKIKAVRFEEDESMPEYADTHNSNCPIHHTPSPVEDRHHSNCNSRQHQSQSLESRTYRQTSIFYGFDRLKVSKNFNCFNPRTYSDNIAMHRNQRRTIHLIPL